MVRAELNVNCRLWKFLTSPFQPKDIKVLVEMIKKRVNIALLLWLPQGQNGLESGNVSAKKMFEKHCGEICQYNKALNPL